MDLDTILLKTLDQLNDHYSEQISTYFAANKLDDALATAHKKEGINELMALLSLNIANANKIQLEAILN